MNESISDFSVVKRNVVDVKENQFLFVSIELICCQAIGKGRLEGISAASKINILTFYKKILMPV